MRFRPLCFITVITICLVITWYLYMLLSVDFKHSDFGSRQMSSSVENDNEQVKTTSRNELLRHMMDGELPSNVQIGRSSAPSSVPPAIAFFQDDAMAQFQYSRFRTSLNNRKYVKHILTSAAEVVREFNRHSEQIRQYKLPSEGSDDTQANLNDKLLIRNSDLRSAIIDAILTGKESRQTQNTVKLGDTMNMASNAPRIWQKYQLLISNNGLPRQSDEIGFVLDVLRNGDVMEVDEIEKGTQIKLRITFTDGTIAVVKPKRVSLQYQTPPDHFYFSDIERHNAEIAAFHMDRILGFYRCPPTTGRVFNLSSQIKPHAKEDLLGTFFISPAGNVCFRGQCKYYCDTAHAVCGTRKDMMEASVQLMLPIAPQGTWLRMIHPFRRSYSAKRLADWETNQDYCADSVYTDENFHSRLMLDMVDTSIYDFMIDNMDRHHLVKLEELHNDSTTFHIDQGRGFGRHYRDDISILQPLIQCCFIRYSTMEKLTQFALSSSDQRSASCPGCSTIGETLRQSLAGDPLSPVLLDAHHEAVDRRMRVILFHVGDCIRRVGSVMRVIIDDGL